MNKILLISFFDSTNIGDKLLSNKLEKLLSTHFNVKSIDFSTVQMAIKIQNHRESSSNGELGFFKKKLIPLYSYYKTYRCEWKARFLSYLNDVDIVCLAGGNMLMDLGLFPNYTYKCKKMMQYAKAKNKFTAFISIGVAPFNGFFQKQNAKEALHYTDFISVRDIYSLNKIKSLDFNKNCFLSPDPAFLLKKILNTDIRKKVAINVFLGHGKEKEIKKIEDGFVNLINKITSSLPEYVIALYSSEINDSDNIYKVYSRLDSVKNIYVHKINDLEDILQLYGNSQLAIITRMHSGIIAFTQHLPIIILGWQDKMKGFAELCNIKDKYFDISDLYNNPDIITNTVRIITNNLETERAHNKQKLLDIKDNIKQGFKYFTDLYGGIL